VVCESAERAGSSARSSAEQPQRAVGRAGAAKLLQQGGGGSLTLVRAVAAGVGKVVPGGTGAAGSENNSEAQLADPHALAQSYRERLELA